MLLGRVFSLELAQEMTNMLKHYPEHYADFMMTYEIQMADPNGENPIFNGLATFMAFICFGIIPLLPYFILEANSFTFQVSVFSTFFALIALGFLRYFVVRQNINRSVSETVLVGGVCAIVAYLVGLAFS